MVTEAHDGRIQLRGVGKDANRAKETTTTEFGIGPLSVAMMGCALSCRLGSFLVLSFRWPATLDSVLFSMGERRRRHD